MSKFYTKMTYKNGERIFKAAEEIKTSEETFNSIITMLQVDFRSYINERNENNEIVNQIKFSEIFSNMESIKNLSDSLLKDFTDCIEKWCEPDNCKIAHVLLKKGAYLKLFADYTKDYYPNQPLFQQLLKNFPEFENAVLEFQKLDCCNNIPITGFLIKPVQRLPQYEMLMKNYLKEISKEDIIIHPDKANAQAALGIVTNAAGHANEKIKKFEDFQEMVKLKIKLGNPKKLIIRGRFLLHHETIKKRARKEEMRRHLILFNDILIVAKFPEQRSSLRALGWTSEMHISEELALEHIFVEESKHKDLPNDFIVNGKSKTYIFVANDVEGKEKWMQELRKAIMDRKTFRASLKGIPK